MTSIAEIEEYPYGYRTEFYCIDINNNRTMEAFKFDKLFSRDNINADVPL